MATLKHSPPGGVAVNKVWYLKHIDIFAGISEEDVRILEPQTVHRRYESREMIFLPGDQGDKVYFLKEGLVKLARLSAAGREVTMAILEPGEIFGEHAFLDGLPRETFAQAMSETLVCIIHRRDFQAFVKRRPDLSMRISTMIGERMRELEHQLEDLAFRDVPARLAALILRLAEKHGTQAHSEGEMIDLRLTHQETASLIGTTRESATINVSRLRQRNLVAVDNHRFVIRDREGLRRIAEEL